MENIKIEVENKRYIINSQDLIKSVIMHHENEGKTKTNENAEGNA